MKNNKFDKYLGLTAAGASFLAGWSFFQFAYPYHLMRREQLNLFLYDWKYIKETYTGPGWLSHFAGDFVDQFLCLPVAGPLLVALILTGIGTVTYKICRHFLGKWPSLGIATLVFGWSFMRETGNTYITQYSVAVLGYLSLALAALQFKAKWKKPVALAVFLAVGVLTLGSPCHKHYGKLWGSPSMLTEKLVALDVNASNGKWDKVLKISQKDLHVNIANFFFNLAIAEKGVMGDEYFNHVQNLDKGLFLWVNDGESQFYNGAAGEVWFRLGCMTQAEQSAVVALQISPKHTGARFFVRLAEITLISGEYVSAQKYLNILSKTLVYRKWALERMPGNMSDTAKQWLEEARARLPQQDIVFADNLVYRDILKELLRVNPDNLTARQYLLVYDLAYVRLDDFIEDYSERMIPGAIYEQAALVWLLQHGRTDEESAAKYGVSRQTLQRIEQFYRFPERYSNTFWYYFMDMTSKYL